MRPAAALAELEDSHARLLGLLSDIPEADLLHQYHPDLSPLAWHLGHTAFTEAFWIRETIMGDDRLTAPLASLYRPELSPKPDRGPRLANMEDVRQFATRLFAQHRELLAQLETAGNEHSLLRDSYVVHFLAQHNQQHAETVMQVLQQRAGAAVSSTDFPTPTPAAADADRHTLPSGEIWLGSEGGPESYDNERPRHSRHVNAFAIATQPVRNAQYLSFVLDDGYRRREFWDEEGWAWRTAVGAEMPDSWRSPAPFRFHSISPRGAEPLHADDTASGVSYYEARAFARYAGGRLPSEAEWEYAAHAIDGFLASCGQAWEWCANAFYPYPGFRAFPYDGYSQTWFDGRHRALRGGSRYTTVKLRRPTFRNFYLPDKRHVFAGVRLAFDCD